jgi:high affinity sulfate transporter 1
MNNTTTGLARYLPFLRWINGYQTNWLGPDAIAGLTVWALVVPESMAYAAIAGVPVQFGLYSVPIAALGYVVFGSSKRLFVGPSSTIAVLSAATVAPLAASGSDTYIALTAALAILVGALYVVLGLLRMGFISRFFAKPVLDGFIVGLGLYIAVGQLYKVVGAPKPSGNTVQQLWGVLTDIGSWDRTTTVLGVTALAILFALAKYAPKVPGALVVVVLGIAVTGWLDLTSEGVDVVGAVPTGFQFVPWSAVTASAVWAMIPGAFGIIIVGFAQSLAIAKAYSAEDNEPIDANTELIGYGAASVGAGVLQGFAPTGSLSKSAAAADAGAKTPVSFLMAAVLVVVTILFIAGVFEDLPEAVLGAIVIHAVSGMIDFRKLTRLWKMNVPDFWLALGALFGVIVVGILAGIVIGLALSLILVLHRLDHPHSAILGQVSGTTRFADVKRNPDAVAVPAVLIYRLEAPLIFANAESVIDDIRGRLAACEPAVRTLVLDFEAVYEIDTEGADLLVRLRNELDTRSVAVVLARANEEVLDYLHRIGCLDELGPGSIFPGVAEAVEAIR